LDTSLLLQGDHWQLRWFTPQGTRGSMAGTAVLCGQGEIQID